MAEESHIENLKIPVGISSCLLGERVRYDGGHKGHSYIRRTLGEYSLTLVLLALSPDEP